MGTPSSPAASLVASCWTARSGGSGTSDRVMPSATSGLIRLISATIL